MPRSPSRDLADRFVGNRGYFHRPDRVRRLKGLLALVALGLSTGWVLLDATAPPRAAYSHSHGPLANPHAPWDSNCAACHKPQAFDIAAPFSVFRARERWHDLTCEKCHAGPRHHAAVNGAGDALHAQCATCHHDHNGRTHSLTRISDSHCTSCHKNLGAHHVGGADATAFEKKVAAFDSHPEFGALRQYPPGTPGPRGLKFSHSVHLTPGLVYAPGGTPHTVASLKERNLDAGRYATPGKPETDPIQLTCASCHQLDAGGPTTPAKADLLRALKDQPLNALLPPRAEGAYYLPVNFDAHCKACHPLDTFPDRRGPVPVESFTLPHRKQPAEVRTLAAAEYARRLTLGGAGDKTRGEVDRLTGETMRQLFKGLTPAPGPDRDAVDFKEGGIVCSKCHLADARGPGAKGDDAIAAVQARPSWLWLPHTKFNHASHRGVSCGECHPGTESTLHTSGETDWTHFEPVRVRGVKVCQQCHGPAGRGVELADGSVVSGGGVRHNCTDCHRYHNGDHALSGRGATARDPQRPRTVGEFLRGR